MCRGRRALDEKDGKTWEREEGRGKKEECVSYGVYDG
jgi:hypothetical protein